MRLRVLLALATTAVVLMGCRDELTASGVRSVRLRTGDGWTDTMRVGELRMASIVARDAATDATVGTQRLVWAVSDADLLRVSAQGDTVVLAAIDAGEVEVQVRIDHPGLRSDTLTRVIVIEPAKWSGLITIGEFVDAILTSRGIPGLAAAVDSIRWLPPTSSSLNLEPAEPSDDPLGEKNGQVMMYGTRAGPVVLSADVHFAGTRPPLALDFPIFVGSPYLEPPAGKPWPTTLQFGDSVLLETLIISASGADTLDPDFQGLRYRSTNPSVLQVDSAGGMVRAIGRGAGEIIATVGVQDEQVTERRGTLRVLQTWRGITTGYRHSCALSSTRVGYCWGNNTFGELGIGALGGMVAAPTPLGTAVRFEELRAGGADLPQQWYESPTSSVQAHSCGRAASYVFCWGANNNNQLGDGRGPCFNVAQVSGCRQSLPREVYDGGRQFGDARAIAAGGQLSCAATTSDSYDVIEIGTFPGFSRVTCWGWELISSFDYAFAPVRPLGARPFERHLALRNALAGFTVSGGGAHACFPVVRVAQGPRQAQCIGDNRWGQLGDGTALVHPLDSGAVVLDGDAQFRRVVVTRAGTPLVTQQLAAGGAHTCALDGTFHATTPPPGAVWCWGANGRGQLGALTTDLCDGGTEPCSRVALPVTTAGRFTAITAGAAHTCALTAQGEAWCWGDNRDGQVGAGPASAALVATPTRVSTTQRFVAIAAGGAHTCGITAAGAAWCWGRNLEGQLGTGSTDVRLTVPTRVTEPPL
ncbi:MAG: hypothetical protein LCH84_02335 [Gemmatimonadetes bacterium]|nr:hypothetical protein [Gemmatimonadota bacterium]